MHWDNVPFRIERVPGLGRSLDHHRVEVEGSEGDSRGTEIGRGQSQNKAIAQCIRALLEKAAAYRYTSITKEIISNEAGSRWIFHIRMRRH